MKGRTKVAVIGGGIAGCSLVYHLTVEGWNDVVLIERDVLTSGTTWHSAAQVTNFGTNQTMIGLKSHSMKLYKELAEDSDHPVSYNRCDGGIRLASTQDHMDGYHHFVSLAKGMGVDFEVIDAKECGRRHPFLSTDNLLGGLWDPLDGHIDPAQLCQSLARRSRQAGAKIYQKTNVEGLHQYSDGTWRVETSSGNVDCDVVVNAGGYRVNEIARMMGTWHPVISMEHQYLVTEPMTAIKELGRRLPLLRCPTDDFYCRQEKQGLLVGFYEQDCQPWGVDGIDPNFSNALCPDDLDRIAEVFESTVSRLPFLASAGIHTVVNGPITYAADGLPLVGPVSGRQNAYCIVGLRAGLGEGGGHGWLLAQQIVHGEACYDTWCLDPRRFGPYADQAYTLAKAIEDYQNEFRFHLPHENRPAGRHARTTQLTPVHEEAGVELTQIHGWERPQFYLPESDFKITPSFRRTALHAVVSQEVNHVHEHVGIAEINGFNRIEIKGERVHEWLDCLSCSPVPRKIGNIRLCYFLNHQGMVKSEATIANLRDAVWYGSAAASEIHDWDWLNAHRPKDGSIRLKSLVEEFQIILIIGPKAKALMQKAIDARSMQKPISWGQVREVSIDGIKVVLCNLSYSGEVAYEIHVPHDSLLKIWNILMNEGEEFRLLPFGSLAIESMRLEKGYRHWKADLLTEFDPVESGLGPFINWNKDFIGKIALATRAQHPSSNHFVQMNLACEDAHAMPGASIYLDGDIIGTVTSADFGHRTQTNLAMGFVRVPPDQIRTNLEIDLLDKRVPAILVESVPFDPDNTLRYQSTIG